MRLLLDTHAFLWWDESPKKLSKTAFAAIEDDNNELYLSLISIWEIQIKMQLGKLTLRSKLKEIIEQQTTENSIQLLALDTAHIYHLDSLPSHHKDPFDRLLIAQASHENLTMITDDSLIQKYSIATLW
jgi:PIN domain nuclease of toxin-antitoxin system